MTESRVTGNWADGSQPRKGIPGREGGPDGAESGATRRFASVRSISSRGPSVTPMNSRPSKHSPPDSLASATCACRTLTWRSKTWSSTTRRAALVDPVGSGLADRTQAPPRLRFTMGSVSTTSRLPTSRPTISKRTCRRLSPAGFSMVAHPEHTTSAAGSKLRATTALPPVSDWAAAVPVAPNRDSGSPADQSPDQGRLRHSPIRRPRRRPGDPMPGQRDGARLRPLRANVEPPHAGGATPHTYDLSRTPYALLSMD